ncbi:MAG: hypothetical protein VX265_11850 [Myxococcota bacterium]|nr:hypothetical protein [Myxococcota bacterium]
MGPLEGGLILLIVSDAVLAAMVLTLCGRPAQALGSLSALTGQRAEWAAGRLTETDEARLLVLADRLCLPALAALFVWSFLVGGVVAAAGHVVVPGLGG